MFVPQQDTIAIVSYSSARDVQTVLLKPSASTGGALMQASSTSDKNAFIRQRIKSVPGICGGEPCIAGTRVPISILIAFKNQGLSDSEILEGYPFLSREDLSAAWNFNTNKKRK